MLARLRRVFKVRRALYLAILSLSLLMISVAETKAVDVAPQKHHVVLNSTTKSEAKGDAQLTVAADGSGDFTSVQQAVDHVPEYNTRRFVIHIKPGIYKEQIKILQTKPFITFRGDDAEKTVLTFNLSAKTSGDTRNSYNTYLSGSDF